MSTQTQLLTTAEKLARSAGYAGFSFADLAHAAGIKKPSVHHHFPTKADLGVRLMQDYTARIEAQLHALDGPAAKQIRGFLDMYRDALSDGETLCLCVSFAASRDVLPGEVVAEVLYFKTVIIDWLDRVFAQAQKDGSIAHVADTVGEARGTLALVEGAQLIAHVMREVGQFDQSVTVLTKRLRVD